MIDGQATVAMLLRVADRLIAAKEQLTQADKMGDGDHGVGMARGFAAARKRLSAEEPQSPASAMKTTGTALLSSIGGAAGAVFGTLFRAGAESIADCPHFDAEAAARFLSAGLDAVVKRGGASVGDKTVVDALAPAAAAAAAQTTRGADVARVLTSAAQAAREGAEATRKFVAKVGKMKSLGERTIGYIDPGALSMYLILDAMACFASEREEK